MVWDQLFRDYFLWSVPALWCGDLKYTLVDTGLYNNLDFTAFKSVAYVRILKEKSIFTAFDYNKKKSGYSNNSVGGFGSCTIQLFLYMPLSSKVSQIGFTCAFPKVILWDSHVLNLCFWHIIFLNIPRILCERLLLCLMIEYKHFVPSL